MKFTRQYYNLENFFSVAETSEEQEQVVIRDASYGPESMRFHMIPEHLLGSRLWDRFPFLSLAEVLVDPQVEFDPETYTVSLANFSEASPGGPLQVEAVLDPDHGFLPKRIKLSKANSSRLQDWTISEFMQVEDGSTGEMRWFPQKGHLKQSSPLEFTLEVQSVAINQPIEDSFFTPSIHKGTFIVEYAADGQTHLYIASGAGPDGDSP